MSQRFLPTIVVAIVSAAVGAAATVFMLGSDRPTTSAEPPSPIAGPVTAGAELPSASIERPADGTATSAVLNPIDITPWLPEGGTFAYKAPLPLAPSDDNEHPAASPYVVLEDGKPLASPHSLHADIDKLGKGRYSHWSGWLIFSASDNSDPRTNGRTYSVTKAAK